MKPEQLLAHFDRISEAPDAVPRLRRFILDLAVQGKLVEQDQRDEPASELLKRIQEEKARLVKEGKIRKQQPLLQIEPEEVPFDIPAKWEWTRLGDIGLAQTGTTPSKNHGDHSGSHIPFIKPGDLYPNNVDYANEGLSETGLKDSGRIAPGGSLLMVCIGTIGKCQLIDRDCSFNQQINSLSPYGSVCSRYLLAACLSEYFQKSAWAASARTTIAILNKGKWELLLFPLPPLAEQHRIVAKVDELMALGDRLEVAQAERESRRDRLAAASLHHLNNGADADAFCNHARFYFNHLRHLTTRPEHVKQLRRTILNLALRGRLTSPWRATAEIEETAQEFLRSVQNARKKAWDSKQALGSGREYLSPTEFDRENLPMIPDSWVWASADAVCSQITDGEHIQPRYQAEGLPMLTAKHVREGFVTFEDSELISESDFKKCIARCKPEERDILIVSVGATTGRAAIVSQSRPFALVRSVLLLKPLISPSFFLRWLQSPWCFAWMRQASEASAQPHLYIGDTKRMPVPLPPLAEQQHILAKVEELMALCDQLEAQLTTTQTESRRLLEAVLHEALSA